jgi:hypothetical protein
MKAKKEQAYGDLLVIKLFTSNYARDLIIIISHKRVTIQTMVKSI